MNGPVLRTDIVDVYVFKRDEEGVALLLLRRTESPMKGTWQPVMGHIEAGETAPRTALRELAEETGLRHTTDAFRGFWSLERVHPFYLPELELICLSPRFVVEASCDWQPSLCPEHDGARWVRSADDFHWPSQQASVRELLSHVANEDSRARDHLVLDPVKICQA